MLTYEDCLGLCELSEEEILAIAEHEHIPVIVAAELGNYMIHTKDGVPMIRRMIVDDLVAAGARGDFQRAAELRMVLRHFVATHPSGAAAL